MISATILVKHPLIRLLLPSSYRYCTSSSTITDSNQDQGCYQLFLYNHYTRAKEMVKIDGKNVSLGRSINPPLIGKVYVCGPTVYDYCHIGHAMAYLRFDIFRRFLQTYSQVNLVTAMGITDIDAKVMDKAKEENKSYREIGDEYYAAFLDDLNALNIEPVDVYVRVTDHVDEIMDYVANLEKRGFAYVNEATGDVNFDTSKVKFSSKEQLEERVTDKSVGKKSSRDFALWRAAQSEPIWRYRSPVTHKELPGRPGWHIECSVIASWLFGSSLDFHFGGKDLIFPHHISESACSSAFYGLLDQPAHEWAKNWFHSSHIKFCKQKMSKSLGNVIRIRDFLKEYDVNILRIMCAYSHYRTDFDYDALVIKRIVELDRRFKQFFLLFKERCFKFSSSNFSNKTYIDAMPEDHSLRTLLKESEKEILTGAADDWNLSKGLNSVLELLKYFDTNENLTLVDLVCLKQHIITWMEAIGLNYPFLEENKGNDTKNDLLLMNFLQFRNDIRIEALKCLKSGNMKDHEAKNTLGKILKSCDEVRQKVESLGYVVSDTKFKPD